MHSPILIHTSVGTNFGFAATTIALPTDNAPASKSFLGGMTQGRAAVVRITNLGPMHIFVKLGDQGVTVAQASGAAILAGQTEQFLIGDATHIAGVAAGGPGNASTVNIAVGS